MDSPPVMPAGTGSPGESRLGAWAASFIYGVIVTLVTVVGLAVENAPNGLDDAGIIIVGDIAIWLAHTISQLVGHQTQQKRPVTVVDVGHQLLNSWPIVAAAIPAAASMALAGLGLWSDETGLKVATALGILALATVGVLTARISERTLVRRILYVSFITMIGIFIVVLEVSVHHL
jgi:hypothetical protein